MAPTQGTPADETVSGTSGDDTVDGLGGNDTLQGLLGDDTYVIRAGSGSDTLFDFGIDAPQNRILFEGLNPADISFFRPAGTQDMAATIIGTGEVLTIQRQFDELQQRPILRRQRNRVRRWDDHLPRRVHHSGAHHRNTRR